MPFVQFRTFTTLATCMRFLLVPLAVPHIELSTNAHHQSMFGKMIGASQSPVCNLFRIKQNLHTHHVKFRKILLSNEKFQHQRKFHSADALQRNSHKHNWYLLQDSHLIHWPCWLRSVVVSLRRATTGILLAESISAARHLKHHQSDIKTQQYTFIISAVSTSLLYKY